MEFSIGEAVVVSEHILERGVGGRTYDGEFILSPGMVGEVSVAEAYPDPDRVGVVFPGRRQYCAVRKVDLTYFFSICGNCEAVRADSGDYLCPDCRADL